MRKKPKCYSEDSMDLFLALKLLRPSLVFPVEWKSKLRKQLQFFDNSLKIKVNLTKKAKIFICFQ